MEMIKAIENDALVVHIAGRLDTSSAPKLSTELDNALDNVQTLILDLADLTYICSAGLRVLLSTQKRMNKQGKMLLRNVCDSIREIFDMTGFTDILTIE